MEFNWFMNIDQILQVYEFKLNLAGLRVYSGLNLFTNIRRMWLAYE